MATIEGVVPAKGVAAARRAGGRAAGAGFGLALEASAYAGAGAADGPAAAGGVAALELMLALQESGGADVADRAARRHGEDVLGALGGLQRELLGADDGADSPALRRLAGLCAAVPFAADPGLRQVIQAVALRGRIELMRRGLQANGHF